MELGQRLKQARLEAGLSQRQLCGDVITRNMLSQIENGSARPSMDTLRYLAERLGKNLSYFLEEQAVTSPNQSIMRQAREAYRGGSYNRCMEILESYKAPDDTFDQEYGLLRAMTLMFLAEKAIEEGRLPYAAGLLEQAAKTDSCYKSQALERQRLLWLSKARPENAPGLTALLPGLDEELCLRAAAALEQGAYERSAALLEAAERQDEPWWNLLRGEVYFAQNQYTHAAECYRKAEHTYPRQVLPRLEICCRELGDYKGAYEYACKQR